MFRQGYEFELPKGYNNRKYKTRLTLLAGKNTLDL
jgi:hypothetical protein